MQPAFFFCFLITPPRVRPATHKQVKPVNENKRGRRPRWEAPERKKKRVNRKMWRKSWGPTECPMATARPSRRLRCKTLVAPGCAAVVDGNFFKIEIFIFFSWSEKKCSFFVALVPAGSRYDPQGSAWRLAMRGVLFCSSRGLQNTRSESIPESITKL